MNSPATRTLLVPFCAASSHPRRIAEEMEEIGLDEHARIDDSFELPYD